MLYQLVFENTLLGILSWKYFAWCLVLEGFWVSITSRVWNPDACILKVRFLLILREMCSRLESFICMRLSVLLGRCGCCKFRYGQSRKVCKLLFGPSWQKRYLLLRNKTKNYTIKAFGTNGKLSYFQKKIFNFLLCFKDPSSH